MHTKPTISQQTVLEFVSSAVREAEASRHDVDPTVGLPITPRYNIAGMTFKEGYLLGDPLMMSRDARLSQVMVPGLQKSLDFKEKQNPNESES